MELTECIEKGNKVADSCENEEQAETAINYIRLLFEKLQEPLYDMPVMEIFEDLVQIGIERDNIIEKLERKWNLMK